MTKGPARRVSTLGELAHGARYVRATPAMLAITLLGLSMGMFGMVYIQFTTAFGKEVLGFDADGTGLLFTATGIGAIIGSIALVTMGDTRRKTQLLIAQALLFPLAVIAFALGPWLPVTLLAIGLLGLASTMVISLMNSIIQLTVPGDLQGRMASFLLGGASMMFVGTLPIGALADAIGLRGALALSGGGLLAVTVALTLAWSPLRRLDAHMHAAKMPHRAPSQAGADARRPQEGAHPAG